MCGNQKGIFLELVLLTILSFETSFGSLECCPPDSFLERALCSDNKTSINLNCAKGSYLLNPMINEYDTFSVESNTTLVFNDARISQDEFCLGKIQNNGSEISVALVCFPDVRPDWMKLVIYTLTIISTIFLLVTIYIYLVLPNLRDLQGKCLLAFMFCLMAFCVTLSVVNFFTNSSDLTCVIQAALLYFFICATFFWNNIIAFNIWRAIRNVSDNATENCRLVIYMLWGFGVPFLMVVISFILEHVPGGNHIRPSFGESKCWFKGDKENWSYFYGPISVLILLNLLMFSQSAWTLWKSYRATNNSKLRSLRYKCFMYLKLFILTGFTWVFEVISFATSSYDSTKYIWIITDCINASQGIIIFFILVVFRQKVRIGLLKKKLCGINWPESWANEEIVESLTASLAEEFELGGPKSKMIGEFRK